MCPVIYTHNVSSSFQKLESPEKLSLLFVSKFLLFFDMDTRCLCRRDGCVPHSWLKSCTRASALRRNHYFVSNCWIAHMHKFTINKHTYIWVTPTSLLIQTIFANKWYTQLFRLSRIYCIVVLRNEIFMYLLGNAYLESRVLTIIRMKPDFSTGRASLLMQYVTALVGPFHFSSVCSYNVLLGTCHWFQ